MTPWTVAHQDPLSMGFPRQEYWSGLHFLLHSHKESLHKALINYKWQNSTFTGKKPSKHHLHQIIGVNIISNESDHSMCLSIHRECNMTSEVPLPKAHTLIKSHHKETSDIPKGGCSER